jgi:hypothetical protein
VHAASARRILLNDDAGRAPWMMRCSRR